VGRGFRGAAAAAAIQRHQATLLAVEAVVCCNLPFVEAAPAQGLALRLLRGRGFFETDDFTHDGAPPPLAARAARPAGFMLS